MAFPRVIRSLSRPPLLALLPAALVLATLCVFFSDSGSRIAAGLPGNQPIPPVAGLTPIQSVALREEDGAPATDISAILGVREGWVLDASFHSDALRRTMPYRVYLPPGYSASSRRYPVVYLLHGGGGSYTEWTDLNHVALFADAMITEGRIQPLILVMPEGKRSYFMNRPEGDERWGDYAAIDLVRHVDSRYRTLANRRARAIGGLSMGGHAALQLAFNYPEVFSIIGANSASMYRSLENAPEYFGDWDRYAGYDPLRMAATRDGLDQFQIWLDIGDQDEWRGPVEELHGTLLSRGVEHQFRINAGHHWNDYWISNSPEYLAFYSRALGGAVDSSSWGGALSLPGMAFSGPVQPAARSDPATPSLAPSDALGDTSEQSLRRAVRVAVRGLRVYAALPDSQYARREAAEALAGLGRAVVHDPAPLAEAIAGRLPALQQAVDMVDGAAMASLASQLEGLNG